MKKVLHLLTQDNLNPGETRLRCEVCGVKVIDMDLYATCNHARFTDPPLGFMSCKAVKETQKAK